MKRITPISYNIKVDFSIFDQYVGKNCVELNNELGLGVNLNSKSFARTIIERLLEHCQLSLDSSEYQFKMIRIDDIGHAKNPSSLKTTDYREIINEEWELSELNKLLRPTYLFFIVTYGPPDKSVFKGLVRYHFTDAELNSAREVWEDTRYKIKKGDYDNFLTDKDTGTFFFKIHASTVGNQIDTPTSGLETYRSFWISRRFLSRIISSCDLK